MKAYPEKLAVLISKSVAPIYLVSGDEPLLVQESCDLIRVGLKKQGFLERDLFHVDGSFDWEQVLFSANSMSLFAEKKLLEIRMPSGKPNDKGLKALSTYALDPPVDTCMLLVMPKIDSKAQRASWFKTIEQAGVFVQIWPIDVANLPRWLNDRFRKAGLSVSREAVLALIDRVEGNLLAAAQEVERLKLVCDGKQVGLDDVTKGVSDSARYDVFGLIDATVGQQAPRAVKIVRGLRAENTEILFIVNMLARELRTLMSMARAVAQGQAINAVLQSYRVWSNRKSLVGRCLQQQSVANLEMCIPWLVKIDHQIKGIQTGEPWDELERLLLFLAGRTVLAYESTN